MPLSTQPYATWLQNIQNAVLAGTTKITNFSSGSVALAFSQALAGCATALQQLITHVYNTNRLATSTGSDVDSFLNDYELERLPLTFATGTLTCTRATDGVEADVQIGDSVQTPGLGILFTVIADTTQSAYDPVRNLYFGTPTQLTIDVTVQASANYGGTIGNIAPNTLTQIVSGFLGWNTVTNNLEFVNGTAAETDTAAKQRFVTYLASLRSADNAAIITAIKSVSPSVTYQIIEFFHFDGTPFPAGFTVVVDDGTGEAGIPFQNNVYNQVNSVRAEGIEFEVYPPVNVEIDVSIHINVATGGSLAAAQANVTAALELYINTLGTGVSVGYVFLANTIQDVTGVFSYSNLLVNGGTNDITIANTQLARAGNITFT